MARRGHVSCAEDGFSRATPNKVKICLVDWKTCEHNVDTSRRNLAISGARVLRRAQRYVISVSLNAFTAETYVRVMPGLDFAQTLGNVERLLDKAAGRALVILTFMVTVANEHEIADAIEFWSERGVMCGAYGIGSMAGTVPNFASVRAKSSPERPHKECYLPLETSAILCNGEMLLCRTDWSRDSACGNVVERSIHDIWNSEPISGLRRQAIFDKFEHPVCRKCPGRTRVPGNLMYEGGPGSKYKRALRVIGGA